MAENSTSTNPSQQDAAHKETDPPLSPEQRAFAEVLGREIARQWKERLESLVRGGQSGA
jgi:hypothetical protein